MANRNYTDADYGICMEIWNNRTVGMRAVVDNVTSEITIARVNRGRLLNLIDGPFGRTVDGELVRLSGLGVKTAEEGFRLGKPALS